jgi:regulatory protein
MLLDDESQRIYSYLLNLLNGKDYSEAELRQKVLKKDFKIELIDQQIVELQNKNWQNDKRLAENIIEFYKTTRGVNWINQKLKMRLLPNEIIIETLENTKKIDEEENFDEIKLLIERKYRINDWNNIDIKTQNKVIWFLQYRGYNNVFAIMNNWKKNQ